MKKIVLLLVICVATLTLSAQKFNPKADFLKGQKEFLVVFDFNGYTLDGDSEEEYVKEKLAKQKTEEDKTNWKDDWDGSQKKWINTFMVDANHTIGDKCSFEKEKQTEYTIIVKVKDVDPGNFAGPFSNPAKISAVISIVKTGSDKVLSTAKFDDIYTNAGITPIESHRIKAAFGRFGDEFADFIKKAIK